MKQLPREEREEKWTRCVARRENALSARTRRWILSPVTNAPFSLFRWTEAGQRVPDVGKRSCYMVMHHRERLMNHVANSLLKWITAGLAIMILPLSCPWKFRLRGRDRGPASTTDWFPVTARARVASRSPAKYLQPVLSFSVPAFRANFCLKIAWERKRGGSGSRRIFS